ncbi:MAG: ABC transporter ATP-binding protein [Chloroflexota bacterium]
MDHASPAIEMRGVRIWSPERVDILRGIDWRVERGQHWALLGPNGSGKSTLLSLAGAVRHPSAGEVSVLGGRFGKTDITELRKRIGVVDASQKVLDWLTLEEIALTGVTASIRPLWDRYGPGEREQARAMLALVGCETMADRPVGTCSQGERQRARIARALITEPDLLLLDEPAVGLDLPAREALIGAISGLVGDRPNLTSVLVTHHLEEIPATVTHALLLRGGEAVAAGPVARVLTAENLSECFGFPIAIEQSGGRWFARSAGSWRRSGAAPAAPWAPAAPLDDSEGF